jgi:hypothetical protein
MTSGLRLHLSEVLIGFGGLSYSCALDVPSTSARVSESVQVGCRQPKPGWLHLGAADERAVSARVATDDGLQQHLDDR